MSADRPIAHLRKSANQTVSTSTWSDLIWQVREFNGGFQDVGAIDDTEIPESGIYEVNVYLTRGIFTSGNDTELAARFRINNSTIIPQSHMHYCTYGNVTSEHGRGHSFNVHLQAGDILTMQARGWLGSASQTVIVYGTGIHLTQFSLRKIGELYQVHEASSTVTGTSTISSPSAVIKKYGASTVTGTSSIAGTARLKHRGVGVETGAASFTAAPRVQYRVGATLNGTASFSAAATRRLQTSAAETGLASFSATGTRRLQVASTLVGTASISGTAILILQAGALSDLTFAAQADPGEASDFVIQGVRVPWSPIEDLTPTARVEMGSRGRLAITNRLRVLGTANLELAPGYTGSAYTLAGPADNSASPKQLGYKKGDRIKLIGPVGGETHDGKILTLSDPATIAVYDKLDPSDLTEYQFLVFRSVG